MNFSVLPPEVNSARIFAGAGSGPTLTAVAAWDRLAGELATAASSVNSVTATLGGQSWRGPASTAMAAAVPYAGWLSTAAACAQRAAGQARAAVAGYEAARATTVHPVLVAANRGFSTRAAAGSTRDLVTPEPAAGTRARRIPVTAATIRACTTRAEPARAASHRAWAVGFLPLMCFHAADWPAPAISARRWRRFQSRPMPGIQGQ